MYKKIKAFTIIDVIIALLISSIIISIAYYVLSLFTNDYMNYQRNTTSVNDVYFFDRTWRNDWERARFIMDKGEYIEMEFFDATIVKYTVTGSALIRTKNNNADTLPVTIINVEKNLYNGTAALIHKIDISIQVEEEQIDCFYTKSYATKELLQRRIQ